jgi:hypothetical protein
VLTGLDFKVLLVWGNFFFSCLHDGFGGRGRRYGWADGRADTWMEMIEYVVFLLTLRRMDVDLQGAWLFLHIG